MLPFETSSMRSEYVTSVSDSLLTVAEYYQTHCHNYNEEFKGVREVLTISNHVKKL